MSISSPFRYTFQVFCLFILQRRGRGEVGVDNLTVRVGDGEPDIGPVSGARALVSAPSSRPCHLQSGFRGLREAHMGFATAIVDELVTDLEHD